MSVILVRVDDRLIHGQVVVGWGRTERVGRIALVDDVIRESAWEQDLYRLGVPDGVDVEFVSVAEAASAFGGWQENDRRTLVLVGNIETLCQLCATVHIPQVNLGGVHKGAGRTERLPYVFLSDDEERQLRALDERGVRITAQDVPTSLPVPLGDLAC